MIGSSLPIEVEIDRLLIRLKQLKAIQEAAHHLIQTDCQAVSTYVAVSSQILEIELELAAQQEEPSENDG